MKVQQKKKDFHSSKDPMEDSLSFLCSIIVMKRYHTLESILCPFNTHAEPEIPSLFRGNHPCSLDAFED
jgi:hypothetical protein